jgi:hypothetical protein
VLTKVGSESWVVVVRMPVMMASGCDSYRRKVAYTWTERPSFHVRSTR